MTSPVTFVLVILEVLTFAWLQVPHLSLQKPLLKADRWHGRSGVATTIWQLPEVNRSTSHTIVRAVNRRIQYPDCSALQSVSKAVQAKFIQLFSVGLRCTTA